MVNRGLAEIHLLDKQVHIFRFAVGIYVNIHFIFCMYEYIYVWQINNLDKQARQFPGSSRGNRKGKVQQMIHDKNA